MGWTSEQKLPKSWKWLHNFLNNRNILGEGYGGSSPHEAKGENILLD